MRAILLLLPVLLAGCGTAISQREVLGRARAEVAARESWGDSALVLVEKQPVHAWSMWRIRAGQIDYSDYPTYEGLDVVPGTERKLSFSRDGCLMDYRRQTTGCNERYRRVSLPATPDK